MKTILLGIILIVSFCTIIGQSVGIGTLSPDPSSVLDLTSDDKGIYIPRLTLAQRDAITDPNDGLLIFQNGANKGLYYFDGSDDTWKKVGDGPLSWIDGTGTVYTNNEVGIGTSSPNTKSILDLNSNDKGILIPRLLAAEILAISSPIPTGLLVFQTDGVQGFYFYNGSSWDLIGKGGNYWSKDTNGLFALSQNVGIGTSYPAVRLNIVGGNGVGLYNGSGYFLLGQESTSNLILDYCTIQARYNGSSALMKLNPFGGNVDIGSTTTSGVKLNIYGGSDASLSGGGYLQTGSSTSTNIVIDNNEIMARNNGTTSDLILQNDGGTTLIGGDLEIDGVVKGAVKFEQNEIDVLPGGSTQSITVGNKTFIQVNCNSSTCTSCSGSGCPHVILSNGEKAGQILILYGPGNPVDNNMLHMPCCDSQTTNYYLKSNFQLDKGNIITLIWLSPVPPEGYWREVSRTEY